MEMRAKVSLASRGTTYCKKDETIPIVYKDARYTTLERHEIKKDADGVIKTIRRQFRVADDLMKFYFT